MTVTEQAVPPFLVCTSLFNLCSLSCVSLCLLIFFVCLCVQTPTQSLLHGSPSPLFTHSLTSSLFQHLSNSPPLPSFSLCLELLVVLRTLAPSPSAAICFGLSVLQLVGWDKALMYFPSLWCQYDLIAKGTDLHSFWGNEDEMTWTQWGSGDKYKFKADQLPYII